MISQKTIASSIKAMEFLLKRISETITFNENQSTHYLIALEKKEAIIGISGGFIVKEGYEKDEMLRLHNMHKEVVQKNKPLFDEYTEAIAELKALQ